MNKLPWVLEPSHQVGGRVSEMLGSRPHSIGASEDIKDVLVAVSKAQGWGPGIPAGRWPLDDLPIVHLRIGPRDFAPDFFQLSGLYYVSAAFRTAAAKAGARAQYAPVDMSGCSSAAHAKDYKVLNVVDAKAEGEDESEGPLALQVPGPRFLYCTDAFATAILRAGLEGVEIYDSVSMTPGRPSAA